MPRIKTIEVRLPVADVSQSAKFFAATLGFEAAILWPSLAPDFAILSRDGLQLQLGKTNEDNSKLRSPCTVWLDVEDLATHHSKIKEQASIEWGPEVYDYGRREFRFGDPDGNRVILSEVTNDPPTCTGN